MNTPEFEAFKRRMHATNPHMRFKTDDELRRLFTAEKERIEIDLEKERKLRDTQFRDEAARIMLTTEAAPQIGIKERLDIISAECVFGMNMFRDFFASVTDIVGGRSEATQRVLRDARKEVLGELRREAHLLGADAVVGVSLNYSEFSGGGKSMLFVVATGTAVVADTASNEA